MLELTSAGTPIALAPNTSVQLEYNSPLFDDEVLKGSFTYGIAVPAEENALVYGFPEIPENADVTPRQLPGELSDDGYPLLRGTQNVVSATARRYSVNLVGGLNAFAAALDGRKLASFAYGGEREVGLFTVAGDAYVPGIVAHANEVVQNPSAYDYIFAPLHNPGFYDPEQPEPGVFVNPWMDSPVPLLGMPAGGSFTFRLGFHVPPAPYEPPRQPPMCPYPWLHYVLSSVFQELGFVVDSAQILPGELRDLVVVSNASITPADNVSFPDRFRLADVLPDVTVGELLKMLRDDFGLVVVLTPENTVRTIYYADVLASRDYVDLTHLASVLPEKVVKEAKGVTLTYRVDSDDVATKDLVADFAEQRVGEPVATLAELPATSDVQVSNTGKTTLPAAQVRLVLEKDAYYKSTVVYVLGELQARLTWAFFARNYRPLAVNGGGELIERGHTTTLMQPATYTFFEPQTGLYPHLVQRGFQVGGEQARSTAVRLLFYRGRQPLDQAGRSYPMLDAGNRNLAGEPTGELSLRLDGAGGTYERWLKAWLQVKLAPVSFKDSWALGPFELSQFEFARKVRVDGVEYLVRKISATAPVVKRCPVELVRV